MDEGSLSHAAAVCTSMFRYSGRGGGWGPATWQLQADNSCGTGDALSSKGAA
ncbi:hypothetical protein PTI98_009080 [Pleurotus ostreatus]|nr:hypothetical protein PTI98_009080 [Pleurotus ostreatus]